MSKPNHSTNMTPNTNHAPVTPAPAPASVESAIDKLDKAERTKNKWNLEDATLTCTFPDGKTTSFDLSALTPDFLNFTNPHKAVIANGVHQKLGDSCARTKADKLSTDMAILQMSKTWEGIVDGSAWTRKGGVGGIGISKQIDEAAQKLSQEDKDQLNEMFKKMGISKRV